MFNDGSVSPLPNLKSLIAKSPSTGVGYVAARAAGAALSRHNRHRTRTRITPPQATAELAEIAERRCSAISACSAVEYDSEPVHRRHLQRASRLLVAHLQVVQRVELLVRAIVVVLRVIAGVEQIEEVGRELHAVGPVQVQLLPDLQPERLLR